MKKMGTFLLLLASIGIANAGFNGITHHSRANCANNESISWDWTNNRWFWVTSNHYEHRTGILQHSMVSGWQLTWRNAAVHWGEGRGGWGVDGYHFMQTPTGQPVLVYHEYVTDCSIYDGWWDKNK